MVDSRRLSFTFLALLSPTVSGCIDGFDASNAYDDQEFLCGEENAEEWDRRVMDCAERADTCGGVLSFEGTLESQPVTIDTDLVRSTFKYVQAAVNEVLHLEAVDVVGATPYFTLSFKLESIGNPPPQQQAERVLVIDQAARSKESPLLDKIASVAVRLTAGGDSVSLGGRTDSGEVILTTQNFITLVGEFHGEFGAEGNEVTGCFQLVPLESFLTVEDEE